MNHPVPHKKVTKDIASNPIARAYAFEKVRIWAIDVRSKLYLMDVDKSYKELMYELVQFLALAYLATDLDGKVDHPDLAVPVKLMGEASAMLTSSYTEDDGRWKKEYATTVDHGIFHALETVKQLKPLSITRAWKKVYG